MNVDDVRKRMPGKNPLKEMFERQKELMTKYHEIEKKNRVGSGAILPDRFDIDDPRCQYICKDFAWRITEELTECMDAPSDHQEHIWEEAADALHFLLELYLMVGLNEDSFPSLDDLFDQEIRVYRDRVFIRFIVTLGLAMNCLKNKPWKQTQVETDAPRFLGLLKTLLSLWAQFAMSLQMISEDAYDYYFKKSEVNRFRQRSRY